MIDYRAKGFPWLDSPVDAAEVGTFGWNLFDGRFLLPTMVIRESALEHNIRLMADWCRDRGVDLAPHGKTTMAPTIFRRQLDAGAWAMTLATPWQANVAARSGVPRILLANEVVDPAGIAWLAATLDRGPETWCWVDSPLGVSLLSAGVAGRSNRLPVLVEVGMRGGRSGARDIAAAVEVARRAAEAPGLRLGGVAFFEGIAEGATAEVREVAVQDLIAFAREVASRIADLVAADGGDEIVLTGGGSQYPHLVAEGLTPPLDVSLPTRVVLRSGCTVTHDHGGYDLTSPFGSHGIPGWPRLRPALEVWAAVLSTPEPGLAIVGAGKRDLAHDGPNPMVLAIRGADGVRRAVAREELTITRLNDQHAYLRAEDGVALAVGDLVAIGVRHPCLAFDRWRWLPLLSDDDTVIGAVELIF